MSLREQIAHFLHFLKHGKNVSANTERGYCTDLEQFAAFFGAADVGAISHQDLRAFLGHLMDLKLRKSSISRKLSAVRAFFSYLNRQGIVDKNPAKLLATPRQD